MVTSSSMRLATSVQSTKGLADVTARQSAVGDVWTTQLPLTTAAFELVQLNLKYLQLPTVESRMLDITGQRFSALSHDARIAAADCLYTLFTVGLNDVRRWLPLLAGEKAEQAPVPATMTTKPRRSDAETEFVATVLFFAWHMARSDPAAARVLLDLHREVAGVLRSVSLPRLMVAVASVHWLEPRWQQNRHFWPALMRHSTEPTGAGLRAVKLLGRQLLAAESLAFPPPSAQAGRKSRSVRASGSATAANAVSFTW
jgi:hypothetical protein